MAREFPRLTPEGKKAHLDELSRMHIHGHLRRRAPVRSDQPPSPFVRNDDGDGDKETPTGPWRLDDGNPSD